MTTESHIKPIDLIHESMKAFAARVAALAGWQISIELAKEGIAPKNPHRAVSEEDASGDDAMEYARHQAWTAGSETAARYGSHLMANVLKVSLAHMDSDISMHADAATLRDRIKEKPEQMGMLRQHFPDLAAKVDDDFRIDGIDTEYKNSPL